MSKLRITLVQSTLLWEDREGNGMLLQEMLRPLRKNTTDVIVLPEMFSSGFTMNAAAVAESMNGPTVAWMREIAAKKNAVVCGSVVIREKKKFFNRFIWVQPDGKILAYDKRHLFRMAGENKIYSAGRKRIIIDYQGWKILPQVCYDLRFPVWSRNTNGYDLMLFVANWPEKRSSAWKTLLPARAIENQCFVAALNRVGKDGKGITYSGDSAVYDMWGKALTHIPSGKGCCVTIALDKRKLEEARSLFPVALDADRFRLQS